MPTSEAMRSGPESEAMAPTHFGCVDFVGQLRTFRRRSRQQFLDYVGRDRTRQLLIEALEFVGEFAVVDPQAMKDRSVEVPHVHRIFHDVIAILVRFSVRKPGAHASADHPCGETSWVVVAAIVVLSQATLAVYGASELARPDHQCVIEQSASSEISNQRVY